MSRLQSILVLLAFSFVLVGARVQAQSTSASQITWPGYGNDASNINGNPLVAGPVWIPVDQAITDQDRLSTSLRQISPGLDPLGQHTRLFRVVPDATWSPITSGNARPEDPTYYRIGPGYRARVDRIDYFVQTSQHDYEMNITPKLDGVFYEYPSLNTVFDLRPIPLGVPTSVSVQNAVTGRQPNDRLPDNRIKQHAMDAQINSPVTGSINGQVDGRVK